MRKPKILKIYTEMSANAENEKTSEGEPVFSTHSGFLNVSPHRKEMEIVKADKNV